MPMYSLNQTGSGKTYTMWGPTNSLSDDNLLNEQKGLTFRVFERLFARINEVGLEVLVLRLLKVMVHNLTLFSL